MTAGLFILGLMCLALLFAVLALSRIVKEHERRLDILWKQRQEDIAVSQRFCSLIEALNDRLRSVEQERSRTDVERA